MSDKTNGATVAPPVNYDLLPHAEAERLFTMPRESKRWGGVLRALIQGQAVFVPGMSRAQLETLRGSIREYNVGSGLRSRSVVRDNVEGRVLRLTGKV